MLRLLALLFLGISSVSFVWAAGPRIGGGDSVVENFRHIGKVFIKDIGLNETAATKKIVSAETLLEKLEHAQIDSTQDSKLVTIDGVLKEAVNFPDENRILIYSPSAKKSDYDRTGRLVIHELLGLLEIPDKNYGVTQLLVGLIRHPITRLYTEILNAVPALKKFQLSKDTAIYPKGTKWIINWLTRKQDFRSDCVKASERIGTIKGQVYEIYFGHFEEVSSFLSKHKLNLDDFHSSKELNLSQSYVYFYCRSPDLAEDIFKEADSNSEYEQTRDEAEYWKRLSKIPGNRLQAALRLYGEELERQALNLEKLWKKNKN